MEITTNFECGGGKRITRLGELHWRLEAPGDASGYTKYFCVQITPEKHESGSTLRLDVHPDADLGEKGVAFFRPHFPGTIWVSRGGWNNWLPFRDTAGNSVTFHGNWFEVHITVESETDLYLASNPPLRYSDFMSWVRIQEKKHGDHLRVGVLGVSVEGREIPVLYLPGMSRGLPRFLIIAGQHPSEHSGCIASQGIVEYLLSPITEAREILDHFYFAVVPMMNPDGNVRGLAGANAEDIDLAEDFTGVAEGSSPRATENRLLWKWLCSEFTPDVMLDLHAGMGCACHNAPYYDGAALFVKDVEKFYNKPGRLAAFRALQERFRFDTPANPAPENGELIEDKFLEYQAAAAFGTLTVLYHVNASMTGTREQFRRGPQLLTAMTKALINDAGMGS